MKNLLLTCCFGFVFLGFTVFPSAAQPRLGWAYQVDGLAAFQGDADLSGGGKFSASRAFLRATALYNLEGGSSVGLSTSFGKLDYNFSQSNNQPWENIRDLRVAVPVRFRAGDTTTVFVSPQIRWDYQSGASSSDGRIYGVFAGIAWQLNERLTIGPAFGAFSEFDESGTDFFPALLIDWDINDRWNLNTGSGVGATQGPGLSLSYALNEAIDLSLTARSERIRFRLDGDGLAPDGVGEDKSIPVVLSLGYNPNPGISLSVFAGAEFDGRLTLDDANGVEISRQRYDTAPLVGLAFRVRF
ncbi:hypothetical protein [Ruegeria sp. HKCCA5426]|uniref:hypothetical protein n=1 Tax=Ruegeria sp. HKCCA5426 TaxID=2682985 RepID=UPI0020C430E1|nr:hypothetical protein [Ruegeria sp. HKCCA5426]